MRKSLRPGSTGRRYAFGAGVLACSLLAACASAPSYVPQNAPLSIMPVEVKVGDFWEYAVRDGYTGLPRGLYRYEVSRADRENITVDVSRDGQRVDASSSHVDSSRSGGRFRPLVVHGDWLIAELVSYSVR